jgi:glycosyltransferase involved in cell wall biosynthesis
MLASYSESIVQFRGRLIADIVASHTKVTVAAPGLAAPDAVELIAALGAEAVDTPMQRAGRNPFRDLRYAHMLYRLFRAMKPAYLLAYTAKPVIFGLLAAWMAGVPRRFALITGLGYAFTGERQGMTRLVVGMLYRAALARATVVFFQNPDDEQQFRAARILPLSVKSMVVNGSGVDIEAYSPQPIPLGPPRFLMICRLLGNKGVREYVEAARLLKASFPSATFRLAGWIDENPDAIMTWELDAWIAEGVVEYLGRLEDVRPAIAGASVYVLPSYREGTPRTVLEAMAMGRPIITTNAPGCRETVVDADNGFLVSVKAVDELVEAMSKFIRDPSLSLKMGGRSRTIAEEKYDVCKVNAAMLEAMGLRASPSQGTSIYG